MTRVSGDPPTSVQPQPASVSDQEISDAYIYLLGRLLVARQQQLDFQEEFKWNEILHRKPGAVDWPNPNLDVAYSEAWVAVDENSCTIVSVPKIEGRSYTVQVLNGWGETLANINERVFPRYPYGDFAVCLQGATVSLPADVQRIDLENLPGVEAFDAADIALDSERDLNPGMEPLQETARAIARAVKDPEQRARVDKAIRTVAFADFAKAGSPIGHGTIRNGWARPAVVGAYNIDYLARTLINYGGIWANIAPEVMYYRASTDGTGAPLSGDNAYTMTFPKDQLPAHYANYFWSVIAVDTRHFRVLPNPKEKYLINEQSKPEYGPDGSLTFRSAAEKPADVPEGNWLPTPKGSVYRLTFRFYGPIDGVSNGTYWPPALRRVN
ncbi:MAG: DUF1214 domain-containing protein [Microvirga sp.]|jgi:hypothetical protein